MPERPRAPRALFLAACAAMLAGGCIDAQHLRSEIIARRQDRFEAWRSEKRGEEVSRPVLSGPLSLEDSIGIALRNSRQIQLAALEKVKASARITEAWSEALPTLELGAAYTRLDRPTTLQASGRMVTLGAADNYALTATLSQPLYRGGAIGAGIRGAGIYSALVDEQKRGTVQAAIFAARKAYYDARLAVELERASAEAVEVAQRHLEDVQKNYRAGALSAFDVLRAEVEVKALTAQDVQAQNRCHLALTTLLNVIGVSQESDIRLSEPLSYRPLSPALDDAVRAAFLQNPDILQGELRIRLQREAVNAARSGFFPQLDAFFKEGASRPDPHSPTHIAWGDAWSAGLSLTYKLFDGLRTDSQVRQARAQLEQNEVSLRDTEERVLQQIKQAIFSLEDAARSVSAQEAGVEQAEQAMRLAKIGFSEGVRKQVEVLDAQRALTSAEAAYANALYDHEIARLQMEQATGALEAPQGMPSPQPAAPAAAAGCRGPTRDAKQ